MNKYWSRSTPARPPFDPCAERPHIQGECAKCGFGFDLYYGLDCPSCKHVGLTGAAYLIKQEVPHVLTESGNYHVWDCPGCEAELLKKETNWLEALYALEDRRKAEHEPDQEQSAPMGEGGQTK